MEKGMIKQPLYNQLVDLLKEKIEMEMEPNDMLPSERELTSRYGLSRTTMIQYENIGNFTRNGIVNGLWL